jgi:hypothetical protein
MYLFLPFLASQHFAISGMRQEFDQLLMIQAKMYRQKRLLG